MRTLLLVLLLAACGGSTTSSTAIDAGAPDGRAGCAACTSDQFCYVVLAGKPIRGVIPDATPQTSPGCDPIPAACAATPTCACIAPTVSCANQQPTCTEDAGVVVTCSLP